MLSKFQIYDIRKYLGLDFTSFYQDSIHTCTETWKLEISNLWKEVARREFEPAPLAPQPKSLTTPISKYLKKAPFTVGLSVKISRCRHLQKIIVNWLVSLLSLLKQQSLLFIDYIYFNKSKSYAWDMQAKLKERKIIMENFAALRKER